MDQKKLIEKEIYNQPHLTEGPKQWGYYWDAGLMLHVENIRRTKMKAWGERYMTGKKILVLGAGFSDVEFCLQYSDQVTAVDISDLQIERIKEKFPNVQALCADITTFTATQQYDVLYCSSILHHLTEDFNKVLSSMSSWLSDDGLVFIQAEPLRLNPMLWIGRKFFPSQYHTPGEMPFILKGFKRQVAPYFTILQTRCDFFLTMFYLVSTRILRLTNFAWFKKISIPVLTVLTGIDRGLDFTPVNELYWLFGMVLKKKTANAVN
jgi:SAM-dependent methyltransferase